MCMTHMNREICGDYSGEDTPVPIPNTEVKLLSADDTWRATSWESKTLPLISFFVQKTGCVCAIIMMYFCVKTRTIDDDT